jgi:DNA-binding FadR family transcriptional regulator
MRRQTLSLQVSTSYERRHALELVEQLMPRSVRTRTGGGLRIHQTIARDLGTAILAGEYSPGDQIGIEVERAEALKVSRTAYREALRMLVAKGLLESRPKAGTHVRPREHWNLLDPDVLAWMFSSKPDEAFVQDLFELRGLLEPAAAELAAARRNSGQLEAMREALEAMRAHGLKTQAGQAADQRFHRELLAASGNRALSSLASSVGAAVQWTTHFKQKATAKPRDPIPDHERIFDAIAASDAEGARSAMQDLLSLALEDMAIPLRSARTGD